MPILLGWLTLPRLGFYDDDDDGAGGGKSHWRGWGQSGAHN